MQCCATLRTAYELGPQTMGSDSIDRDFSEHRSLTPSIRTTSQFVKPCTVLSGRQLKVVNAQDAGRGRKGSGLRYCINVSAEPFSQLI